MTLLAVCGSTHRESYFDMVMATIVGPIIALAVVIILGFDAWIHLINAREAVSPLLGNSLARADQVIA